MKRVILSSLLFLILGFTVQGQTEFGLKAGLNSAQYNYKKSEIMGDTEALLRYYLAGYLDTRMTRWLYLHPEISLQGKGSKLIESEVRGSTKIIQKVNWLDLTFNFLGKLPVDGIGSVFAGAGPYVGFTMDGTNTTAEGNSTTAVIIYEDNALERFDYGVNLLTGVKFGKRLSLNVSYKLGLRNIAEDYFKWSPNVKNRVFSVGLGFAL
ncbi:MAG: outer membrane beta-barrel protein [Sphingobacterium composti]|uniref:outer membrane beta-barrel protein n=1 Tax=Sphingobacterium composti TaxID=363260 RepID=UPI00135CF482|nr:outer membrane beta-barrel protein [Sphingobacterium composti Ten et al. 2007 non Yoo et al. 2007]